MVEIEQQKCKDQSREQNTKIKKITAPGSPVVIKQTRIKKESNINKITIQWLLAQW